MISSRPIERRLTPSRALAPTISASTFGSGRGEIESFAGLLAEAAGLAQRVCDLGAHALCLAHAPTHVEAGEIAHGERPHRKTEFADGAVDLVRQRAFEQEPFGLDAARA